MLINHGLGSRVRSPETTDLVEGGVVTEKRRTPEDTREHHTQYNRQTTALHSHRPLASGCRRGMQLHRNVVRDYSLVSISRTPPHCEGHSAFPVDNRDEETMGGSTDSTPQWTWGLPDRSPAMATAYSPPHANRRGVRSRCGNAEQQATAHPE